MVVFFVSLAFLMAFAYLFPDALALIFVLAVFYWWILVPVVVLFGAFFVANRTMRG
jgi:hypothetical protein